MDTPFGRLDPNHRANILRALPNMADQIVLLVHEGELRSDTDLEVIKPHISAIYEIHRVSEIESKLMLKDEGGAL
jgi:DNA sulfur modification protein DndD